VEGLFRLSGDLKSLSIIKPKLDCLDVNEAELFKLLKPHDAASLLKHFFKELPEPVLTFALYPKLMALQSMQPSPSCFVIHCLSYHFVP
jgi:hypothetical protein